MNSWLANWLAVVLFRLIDKQKTDMCAITYIPICLFIIYLHAVNMRYWPWLRKSNKCGVIDIIQFKLRHVYLTHTNLLDFTDNIFKGDFVIGLLIFYGS